MKASQFMATFSSAGNSGGFAPREQSVNPNHPDNCGQPDRDRETLRKFAEKYAVMALCNLPDDYESRKRIITSAIVAALTSSEMQQIIQNAIEEIEGPDYGGAVSDGTLDDMRAVIRKVGGEASARKEAS